MVNSSENHLLRQPLRLHKRNWIGDGEEIAVTSPLGKAYWLNETGAFIWKMCDGNHSTKDIVDAVIKRYYVNRNTALRDVLEFILSLEKLRLIGWR